MTSFLQQQQLASRLLKLISTCPGLPIKGGSISLDKLRAEGRTMSIHFQPGQIVRAYTNGRKVVRQPFGISYRAAQTDDDEAKSAMLGSINSIGLWLEGLDRAQLDIGVHVKRLEQATWASIIEQGEGDIAYMGDFVLEYDQRTLTAA